jgi:hypothetical protein
LSCCNRLGFGRQLIGPQHRYVSRGRELVGSEGAESRMLAGSLRIERSDSAWRHDPNSMRAGPGAVLPPTLLGEGGKRGIAAVRLSDVH